MPAPTVHPAIRFATHMTVAAMAAGLLSSCSTFEQIRVNREKKAEEIRQKALRAEAGAAHANWRATRGWKSKTYRNADLLAKATPENTAVEISLNEQRGLLLVDTAIAMDFPVATGKRSHPTPAGEYKILGKQKDYSSNLYGKIVDAAGVVVVSDADTRSGAAPEGTTFVGARMPYWMRLTNTGVGMHVGYVPGHPASHGCIRLKRDVAVQLFEMLKVGTPVKVAPAAPALAAPVEAPPKQPKKAAAPTAA